MTTPQSGKKGISFSKLKNEYDRLTDKNFHSEAAQLLVDTFGKDDEKEVMKKIVYRHHNRGYITSDDYAMRYEVSQKYYNCLVNKTPIYK